MARLTKHRLIKEILKCISPQGSTVHDILQCLEARGYNSMNIRELSSFIYYNMRSKYVMKKTAKVRGRDGRSYDVNLYIPASDLPLKW